MVAEIIQASTPEALKAKIQAIIDAGKTISLVVETSQKTFYLVIRSV